MTILICRKQTEKHTVTIELDKGGAWRVIAWRNGNSDMIQACDIVRDRRYYSEKAARDSMNRIVRELTKGE